MLRRIIGFCLWWLAFTPALSLIHRNDTIVVSILPLLALCIIEHKNKLIRIGGWCIYIFGLLGMLYVTQHRWLLSPAIWGWMLILGLAVMYLASRFSKKTLPNHDAQSEIQEPINVLNIHDLLFNIKFPIKRMIGFYLIWMIGGFWIALKNLAWAPVVLIAWSLIMMLLGYYSIWPFMIHPEWIGYAARRDVFVSKGRWCRRFIASGFFIVSAFTFAFLYMTNE